MRTALAATAFTALALFTAAPTALATNDGGGGSSGDHARQAERLMRAADKFDRKAGSMRTRAGRLRATALELRQEAEELAAPDAAGEPTSDVAMTGREGGSTTTTTTTTTTTSTTEAAPEPAPEPDGDGAQDECAWDGEDDLGLGRHGDEMPTEDDESAGNGEEICHLLRTADRLEQRAGALDAAAARMQQHATKLREKATKLLGADGKDDAEHLLKKAAKLRESATKLRAYADELRETAFDGADVDDETVSKIRHLELKAAAKDARADRLEARAAAMVG